MRIKEIKLVNNPFFGNMTFDFTDYTGKIVDTIIIAGENGCGKTRLLDIIFDFSLISTSGDVSDEKRIFKLVASEDELNVILAEINELTLPVPGEFEITQDFSAQPNYWSRYKVMYASFDKNNEIVWMGINSSQFFSHSEIKSIFKSLYSTVEINYNPGKASTVTSIETDSMVDKSLKSSVNLASEIQQLFIDIQNNDANELQTWVDLNDGMVPPADIKNRRIKRFKNAFATVFENLNYYKIETKNNMKHVLFRKNNLSINISDLSSGEKQIVFRGAFLLKDQQSVKGCVVLIDEPEISLHPIWQEKILDYYRNLFIDRSKQTSQLFIATHSPFVIHNNNRYNDKVIVFKNIDGKIIIDDKPTYVTVGSAQIIKDAFNIVHFNSTKPTVFVEGETDEKYINTYLKVFKPEMSHFSVQWIGAYNGKRAENTGDKALNSFFNFLKANPSFIDSRILLLYDSDTNKPEQNFGNIAIRTMPKNEDNTLYIKGIENLLALPYSFDKENFYKKYERTDEYGATSIIRELDKTKLCDYICEAPVKKEFFENFEEIFNKIENGLA